MDNTYAVLFSRPYSSWQEAIDEAAVAFSWEESLHPRGEDGKFTDTPKAPIQKKKTVAELHTEIANRVLFGDPLTPDELDEYRSQLGGLGVKVPPIKEKTSINVMSAFDKLDGEGNNFVSIVDLQKELGVTTEELHAELKDLRNDGKITFRAAGGRHGISDDMREAGIIENDQLMAYVSKRQDT